ncbi:cyclic nucleotide-binding domain-containing protein [Sorangium sp. So ce385]|uniref:cyclic nucleotide-binding domain-containing protein n=1 Tax=Sorangium sp. So ce385 TaxID=3133308 RepID=UPI003F5BD9E9
MGDRDLAIPHDWIVVECRLPDQSITRYHIEGPLPQTFEFGGKRLATRDVLAKLSPVSLLLKILYAMGVPFDAVDRRRLVDFYHEESSSSDATDIVATWVGGFQSLRLGGEKPIWCGTVPGNDAIEYAVIGEALQNAWYRFGVGVDDAFAGATLLAQGMDLAGEARLSRARRFEHVMIARSVHILYHLFSVTRNTEQGVVGPVLTEYYMDEQHGVHVADARLRDVSSQGAEMLAAACDVWTDDPGSLVDAALDHLRDGCCRRVMSLLGAFSYPAEVLDRASLPMKVGDPRWRSHALDTLAPALSSEHNELVARLFASPEVLLRGRTLSERARAERLVELAMGRYAWVSPWLRACALRALDPAFGAARGAIERAVNDPDPLVAETAAAQLGAPLKTAGYTTIDKVMVLHQANLFRAVPHQVLAGVAALLTEREVQPGERVVEKGELGDCLYVIASGRVRVHDGDRTFQQLGTHQVFGELSLLDASPRAASVTAVERTRLFRLEQGDFYALLSERPDMTRAINRALCAMVRAANAAASGAGSERDHARADARRVAVEIE